MKESLIEVVAKLRELEANATPAPWMATEDACRAGEFIVVSNPDHWIFTYPEDCSGVEAPDAKLISALRNAAPALLGILSEIRPGDADILQLFVEFMENHRPDGHLNDTGKGAKITNAKATDCLRRYQAMAASVEVESE